MNHVTFNSEGEIRPAAVVGVGLALSAVALGLDLGIAGAAPAALGSPGDAPALGFVKVLLSSVPAVLGNTLGFYLSYRSPHPRALRKFLAPAAGFYLAFMVPPVWALVAGGEPATFAVAAVLNTVPVALAVPALLVLRPDVRAARVPAVLASNA